MDKLKFHYTKWRPNPRDESLAVLEKRVVYASSREEAAELVARMPAATIGGRTYPPVLNNDMFADVSPAVLQTCGI